jgi:PAS domain S-box-containing protein
LLQPDEGRDDDHADSVTVLGIITHVGHQLVHELNSRGVDAVLRTCNDRLVVRPRPDGGFGGMRQRHGQLDESVEPGYRVRCRLGELDDSIRLLLLPVLDQTFDEAIPAAEVVVERPARDLQCLAQRTDGEPGRALFTEELDRLLVEIDSCDPGHVRNASTFRNVVYVMERSCVTPPSLRVLIIEGDDALRGGLTAALECVGHEVIAAPTCAEANAALARFPDVVIVDRTLPDGDGMNFIAAIRSVRPHAHVVLVSDQCAEAARVAGLVAGADDYLMTPVSIPELVARVTAVAHRLDRQRPHVLRLGPLVINVERRLALLHDQPIDFTRREFDLLHHLAANRDRAISRAELLSLVWASSAEWQSQVTVTEHIRRIRAKLEADPMSPRWIASVPGVGYRIDVPNAIDEGVGAAARVVVKGATILHATPSAADLVGAANTDEMVGQSVNRFIAPASIAAFDHRTSSNDIGEWPLPEIITLVRCDGTDVHVELASAAVYWDGERCDQITMWPLDGRTQRLRTLVTGITTDVAEAVIISSADFRIESFNRAAERLYGWSEEDVLGRNITDVLPWAGSEDDLARATDALVTNGHWQGRATQLRRDGSPVTVMANTTLLRDESGLPVGVISVNRPSNDPPEPDKPVDDSLVHEITRGLADDEFFVEYQPIVRLADRTVIGYEALVRWLHPDRGRVPPVEFIEAAEQAGLIADIGARVLEKACAQLGQWSRDERDVHLAVNVSARQLDDRLVRHLDSLIEQHDLRADQIWLEVTETALVDDLDRAIAALDQLVGIGVRVAIDDFGTGWATLTYLRHFPVSALKIDSAFVNQICSSTSDRAIVRSVLSLGHELDLAVVAEGIESEEQVVKLIEMGCTIGQGFLFGRPQPAT